jgi:large subunit ribosomal protein L21
VEKLSGQPGSSVVFDDVLLVAGDPPKIGRPVVRGARVTGEIIAQDRASKVVVFKFKRRKKYRRKAGHRQAFTEVKITSITS